MGRANGLGRSRPIGPGAGEASRLVPDKTFWSFGCNTLRLMIVVDRRLRLPHPERMLATPLPSRAQGGDDVSLPAARAARMVCGARCEPDKDMFEARNYFHKEPR